jgi:hypothetical protein
MFKMLSIPVSRGVNEEYPELFKDNMNMFVTGRRKHNLCLALFLKLFEDETYQ